MKKLLTKIGIFPAYSFITLALSFFNYYGISVFFAINYDTAHHLQGGPATMVMAFMLGPLISFVIVVISAFLIRRLYLKGYYKTIGIYSLLNYLVCLFFSLFMVYAFSMASI